VGAGIDGDAVGAAVGVEGDFCCFAVDGDNGVFAFDAEDERAVAGLNLDDRDGGGDEGGCGGGQPVGADAPSGRAAR